MTGNLPTGWQGRVLALSLALVLAATAYLVAVPPLLELYAGQAMRIETRQAMLLRLDALKDELPALKAQLAELRSAANSDKMTLDGTSDAVASAALQGRIERLAAADGVAIGSTESLAPQTQDRYRRVGLRLVLSAPYAGLVKLLAAIESERPPLIIDELQVHTFQRRAGAAPQQTLDASLQVYGFRADEAEPARK